MSNPLLNRDDSLDANLADTLSPDFSKTNNNSGSKGKGKKHTDLSKTCKYCKSKGYKGVGHTESECYLKKKH